jgi:hypothetical protein
VTKFLTPSLAFFEKNKIFVAEGSDSKRLLPIVCGTGLEFFLLGAFATCEKGLLASSCISARPHIPTRSTTGHTVINNADVCSVHFVYLLFGSTNAQYIRNKVCIVKYYYMFLCIYIISRESFLIYA